MDLTTFRGLTVQDARNSSTTTGFQELLSLLCVTAIAAGYVAPIVTSKPPTT